MKNNYKIVLMALDLPANEVVEIATELEILAQVKILADLVNSIEESKRDQFDTDLSNAKNLDEISTKIKTIFG